MFILRQNATWARLRVYSEGEGQRIVNCTSSPSATATRMTALLFPPSPSLFLISGTYLNIFFAEMTWAVDPAHPIRRRFVMRVDVVVLLTAALHLNVDDADA